MSLRHVTVYSSAESTRELRHSCKDYVDKQADKASVQCYEARSLCLCTLYVVQ